MNFAFTTIDWSDMHPSMWYARAIVDQVYREVMNKGAQLTSARRPKAAKFSYHSTGRAIDIRVLGMTKVQQHTVARMIRERLGTGFDVIVEGPAAENPKYLESQPHIHIEYEGK